MADRAALALLFALAGGILAAPAQGAVRTCGDFVDNSGGGRTEKEARTNALSGWMKKVEALGMEQVRWQMAADRSLQCQASGGSYFCAARARPCVIKQVAPEDWRPQYPRDRRP